MRFPSPLIGVIVVASALVLHPSPGGAQPGGRPAALVLELSGGQIAGVAPFREVAAGTTVTVPAGTKLVFQHYGSCRRFTLVGGTATIRTDGVDFSGGARPTETRAACPKKLTLKESGESAGVVMRSIGGPLIAVPPRPEFLIVGARAADFTTLRVRRGSEVVVEQAIVAGRPTPWPANAPTLAVSASYELELLPAQADGKLRGIGFRTLDSAAGDDPMTLVSVE